MKIIPVLKAVLEIVPLIGQVFAIFRRKKAQKECRKIEHAAESVIRGVQRYRDMSNIKESERLRDFIKEYSLANYTESTLNPLVKKFTRK